MTGLPDAGPSASSSADAVLAIDQGTGGPKVGVVRIDGTILWQVHVPIATHRRDPRSATQDAEQWWQVIDDATRRALASPGVDAARIGAVAVTGQWGSTVPVDAGGHPVGECIVWGDTRGARHVRPLIAGRIAGYAARNALTWVRRTGGAPSPGGGDPIGHMLFLDRECPEVARAARWYLEPVDYLTMRFTGVASASHASMVAAWLTDNRRLDRLAYDDELTQVAGIDTTKLPPLRPTGSVIGPVTDDVAAAFGLPRGVAVVTGLPDLHSAVLGSGAVGDYEAHLAISTSAWIGAPVPFKKTDTFHSIASVPGVRPDRYVIVNNHDTGGRCLEWLRDQVLTTSTDAPDYDALVAEAATSPPGSRGVIFTPWLAGERSPVDDRRVRAGFHNLGLGTGRADLVRGVLEGVAYNNRWLHSYVERFCSRPLDPIRVIGGGAQSDLWCQIHADVMGRTIERVAEPLHAGLRGAALAAAVATGRVRYDEVRSRVPVDAVFTPDPAHRARYETLYREFPGLYRSQKAMFARLARAIPTAEQVP